MKHFSLLLILTLLIGCTKPTTSFMSFNLRYDTKNDKENWWGYRKEDVANQIIKYNPDFFGTQEAQRHQIDFLTDKLPSYQFIGVSREDGKEKGEYAALFYNSNKFKLVQQNTFWLSETPDTPSKGWDAALNRIATYGVFLNIKNQHKILVLNTHFDHIGSKARVKSAELILEKIKELKLENIPVVVMGDLNAKPNEAPINQFTEALKDSRKTAKVVLGIEGTFNAFDTINPPKNRIDYIFTKNLEVQKLIHIEEKRPNGLWVSDHLAVYAEVQF